MFRQRDEIKKWLFEVIERFRQRGAVSPERAMTAQELGLPLGFRGDEEAAWPFRHLCRGERQVLSLRGAIEADERTGECRRGRLEFTEKNTDAENSSDDHGRSVRDSHAGKHLCSELGNESDLILLPGCVVSGMHSADLLSVKGSEEGFLVSVARMEGASPLMNCA